MSKCKFCDEDLKEVIQKTVRETLTSIGIEASDPLEAQRDFQFLRDMRKATRSARTKAFLGLVAMAATGLAYAVWEGVKALVRGH